MIIKPMQTPNFIPHVNNELIDVIPLIKLQEKYTLVVSFNTFQTCTNKEQNTIYL